MKKSIPLLIVLGSGFSSPIFAGIRIVDDSEEIVLINTDKHTPQPEQPRKPVVFEIRDFAILPDEKFLPRVTPKVKLKKPKGSSNKGYQSQKGYNKKIFPRSRSPTK